MIYHWISQIKNLSVESNAYFGEQFEVLSCLFEKYNCFLHHFFLPNSISFEFNTDLSVFQYGSLLLNCVWAKNQFFLDR